VITGFRTARGTGEFEFRAAFPTMSCHCHASDVSARSNAGEQTFRRIRKPESSCLWSCPRQSGSNASRSAVGEW
jgi:hypothetical protein